MADRYTLERELGRGGMATVYLARDLKHDRRVALKVLHPELGASLGPERFLREIKLTARLQHPHILPVFDSGESQGQLWYTMPYVEGESLRQRLRREIQLSIPETIRVAREVAAALHYAHGHRVVHRDIKPENILLAGDKALVADFGLARALDAAGGEQLTETGIALGTPAYMSPEQASAGQVDARSDIYALGCVVYEMLAGEPPFTGPTAQAIMAKRLSHPVPRLRTVRETVPESIDRAVEVALAKVPADRFATAEEFVQALEEARQRPGSYRRIRRHARWLPLTAVVLALVVGGLLAIRAPRPAVLSSSATIAVLPVLPSTEDTLLTRLGRDLAVTIAASLDGLGEIRTVDRLSIAAATAGKHGPFSLKQSAELGRRFGAGSVLRGTLVRVGPNVRLDLGLYEVAGLRPVTGGLVASAPLDSLTSLTDSVTWSLLRQIWQGGVPPTPSLTSVTTGSVPALRAFLEGERDLGQNRWDEAALAYRAALAADSTFWLAYQRYAETQAWREEAAEPELLDRLARHRDALPERDRLLADAILSAPPRQPSSVRTLGLYEEVTRRFPNYWPGWFLYGDRLVHFGGLLGLPWTRARDAMERATAGNPNLTPAWQHLFLVSVGRDTALPALCAARLRDLGFFAEGDRLGEQTFRLLAELSRQDSRLPDSLRQLADTIARHTTLAESRRRLEIAPTIFLDLGGFPRQQVDQNRRVLALGVDPETAAANLRGISLAWAARGAWDSALVASDAAVAVDPGPTSALEAYRLAVLGAWLGTISPVEGGKRRHAAWLALERLPADPPPVSAPTRLAWLDGVLAFAERDRQAIELARRALRQQRLPAAPELRRRGQAVASFNDRSLAALARALAGDSTQAGRALASLEWECAGLWDCGLGNYDLAVHHLAAARWLRAAGDTAEATRLLLWHQAFQTGSYWNGTLIVTALAYLELARIEEARGATPSAIEYYRQFLRRYDAPMASERHLVEEARQALAQLSRPDRSS